MPIRSETFAPPALILRPPQVCKVAGLGRPIIYQLESECRFPMRVRIGSRAVVWVESEVQLWRASRIENHRVDLLEPL